MKSISVEIGSGQQSVKYTELLTDGVRKLRLSIKSDVYKFQSSALVEVWSPLDSKWNEVHSIHYDRMTTKEGLILRNRYQSPSGPVSKKDFATDRNTLIKMAKTILS